MVQIQTFAALVDVVTLNEIYKLPDYVIGGSSVDPFHTMC